MSIKAAFDVDGTLIHESDDSPRYDVIQLFHLLEKFGCHMIIWSGGGVDYATRWAQKLGLKAEIIVKGSIKVDIAVDDMAFKTPDGVNLCVGTGWKREVPKL